MTKTAIGAALAALLFGSIPAVCDEQAAAPGAAEKFLDVTAERAFPNLRLNRPIIVTHAGDGSSRLFVASQLGKIHVFPNRQDIKESELKLFIDMEPKVVYHDNMNEEGLLGFAFHPKFKEIGQFFLYYSTTDGDHTTVVSRFRVSKDDPDKADPASEEELLRIAHPYWNHKGGTLAFGPDGFLYIAVGDGGAANDPHGNGQSLKTMLGKLLRIDVDRRDQGKKYAVPADNPFVKTKGAAPEIWAYGLRNVWRHAFDRETGLLWAGDVGQDIWEEIDIIEKGGNYGWNVREGKHPFGPKGAGPRPDLIDPIWEYHHNVGKSITGGLVYRGSQAPALAGKYLYADYVTNKLWALDYDSERKKVVANYSLHGGENKPVITYGEDEAGEVYFTDAFGFIWWFKPL
jgi:quinoprotein glucose dehydrogenase